MLYEVLHRAANDLCAHSVTVGYIRKTTTYSRGTPFSAMMGSESISSHESPLAERFMMRCEENLPASTINRLGPGSVLHAGD